jgi:predicted DNA-binding protein with PD1-like motif
MIANGKLHTHISVSGGRGTYGGYLEPESRILYLAEIVIAEITGASFKRVTGGGTGLSLLKAV